MSCQMLVTFSFFISYLKYDMSKDACLYSSQENASESLFYISPNIIDSVGIIIQRSIPFKNFYY